MKNAINEIIISKNNLIITPGSVASDRYRIFEPNCFNIPSENGINVEINSASLK